jgi:hypothetical protein
VTFGTGGVTGGSIGGGISKDRTKSTTHTNTTLNANTIHLNTTADASIRGANIHSIEATNLNIGGNLEVASLQDRNTHSSIGIDASVGFSTDTDDKGAKTGETTTAAAHYNSSNGNYIAVTNQTSITSDGAVTIDTKGNTHLTGALIDGTKATDITTATLTTENITNRADYNALSVGASYTHSTTPDKTKDNGIKPEIGLPQDIDKTATTHTAIADNAAIHITDEAHQTQDTDTISRDTEHASYTMTQINTEVLDIRADISKEISKDGFKAVGDLAMEQGWEDGSIEKTLAHAAMGAVVAGIGNGDAIGGALGAGAAEAARPATAHADDATQQWASAAIGAIAGGGTGASTARDGEEYNRQLHQREIALIRDNAAAFAAQQGITPEEALKILSSTALAGVDSEHAQHFGIDAEAQAFLQTLAEQNGGVAFVAEGDTRGRTQHMFQETDSSLYNNHAVNANALFTNGAREVYDGANANLTPRAQEIYGDKEHYPDLRPQSYYANTVANLATGSRDLANEGQETYANVIIHASELSNDDTLRESERAELRNASQTGVQQGMHNGGIDPDSISMFNVNDKDANGALTTGAQLSRIRMGGRVDATNALNMATIGVAIKNMTKLPNGRVRVELEDGRAVEVPQSAVVIGPNGGKGIKTSYKSPEGYDIIQRESGGYYYTDATTGKQVRVNSPGTHGNVLNDTPAECYGLYCRDTGELVKIGETTHGEVRYGSGSQRRYTGRQLDEMNAEYKKMVEGTKKEMYKKQIEEIEAYKQKHGKYPKYNINGR